MRKSAPHKNTTPAHRLLWLVIVLLLGFALRIDSIATRSLWADEGWTMLLSKGPGLGDITRTLAADQHPPLFFMIFRLWRDAAGETEFATRYLSLLISVLALAGIYQLGRSLFHPTAGLLAMLILALADLHIDLAQEVRHYSLMTTLGVFASLFYIRWWRNPTRAARAGYVLTSLGLLYTHYLGGFFLFAHLAHMLLIVRPWARLREALFLFGSVCLGFLPWLPVVIDQNRLRWQNPLYYQNSLPNSHATLIAVRNAVIGQNAALIGGLLLLGVVYVAYSRSRPNTVAAVRLRPVGPVLFLLLWIGLMTGITVVLNASRQFLTVRNFIVIVPAIALLAGHGLTNLPRYARGFMVALIVIVGLTTVDARRQYPDWRAVTQNVTRFHLLGEPVLMDVWVGDFPVRYYIDRQMGEDTPRVSLREWRDRYRGQFLPTLLDYIQNNETDAFWLIYWGDAPLDEYGPIFAQAGYQRTASLPVMHDGTPIYSYRYDRLTDSIVARFGDAEGDRFALRKFTSPTTATPGDTITVSLWWTAEQPLGLDYSVSVLVLDSTGTRIAQHDEPPLAGEDPTSTWATNTLKFDVHRVTIPADVPPGEYTIGVRMYWYGDNIPLTATMPGETGDYAPLGMLTLQP